MRYAFVEISLSVNSKARLSNEQTILTFRTHHNHNADIVFEIYFSCEFDDKLCHGYVICAAATITDNSGVSEREV